MFVIQLESGQTCGFNTADELRAAIRRGELGPASRVYHRTSDRWLPLTVHPVYRRVEAEHMEFAAQALQRRHWTFLPREAQVEEPDPAEATAAPADHTPRASAPADAPAVGKTNWFQGTLRRLKFRSDQAPEQS